MPSFSSLNAKTIAEVTLGVLIASAVIPVIKWTVNQIRYSVTSWIHKYQASVFHTKLKGQYPKYFGDIGTGSKDKPCIDPNNPNILMLFHGKFDNMYMSDVLDFHHHYTYLLDNNANKSPDIVANLCQSDALINIPSQSIDKIIVNQCNCCVGHVFQTNPQLISELVWLLKPIIGEIWFSFASPTDVCSMDIVNKLETHHYFRRDFNMELPTRNSRIKEDGYINGPLLPQYTPNGYCSTSYVQSVVENGHPNPSTDKIYRWIYCFHFHPEH